MSSSDSLHHEPCTTADTHRGQSKAISVLSALFEGLIRASASIPVNEFSLSSCLQSLAAYTQLSRDTEWQSCGSPCVRDFLGSSWGPTEFLYFTLFPGLLAVSAHSKEPYCHLLANRAGSPGTPECTGNSLALFGDDILT